MTYLLIQQDGVVKKYSKPIWSEGIHPATEQTSELLQPRSGG